MINPRLEEALQLCMEYYQEGFVYLMGDVDGPFKVGNSTNLKARFWNIKINSGIKDLKLIHYCRTAEAVKVEARVLARLERYQVSGEWFNAPISTIIAVMDEEASYAPMLSDRTLATPPHNMPSEANTRLYTG